MSDTGEPLRVGAALQLLTEPHRRETLRRVADSPDGTTVDQLAAHLGEAGGGPADDRRVRLRHVHLPLLDEAGAVSYDADAGTVVRGPQFEAVLALLETVDGHREDAATRIG